jgi:Holliday junction resolvase RusA-like endonuclease
MATYRFEIIGPPRTKGNSRVFASTKGKPVFLPSAPYRKWLKAAMQQLPIIRLATRILEPLRCPVRVSAVFYRQCAAGDLDNFKKGLGDYLHRARLIENDRQIVSWDGSKLDKDAARPRVEVAIQTMEVSP